MKRYIGFTLTEVLLAIAIVGIIAALVLPIIISNYTNDSLDKAYEKEIKTINNALSVDSLVYFDTIYGSTDNMDKFMKKYFKISKYCGKDNGDCFASKYYTYEDNDKVAYTPTYEGACASLKNGMSLCLTPTKGLIDINGKKGPNIKDKDLREFSISFDKYSRNISKTSSTVYHDEVKIKLTGSGCKDGEYTEECCLAADSLPSTNCCNFSSVKEKYSTLCTNTEDACSTNPASEECCLSQSSLQNTTCCQWASVKAKFSSLCNTTTCSTDSSEWDQECCVKNKSSVTLGHHCCSYRAYDDTIYSKCCRTTGYFVVKIECSNGTCTPYLGANGIYDNSTGSLVPTTTVKNRLKVLIGSTACLFGYSCTPPTNTNTTYTISVTPLGGYNYAYGTITPTVGSSTSTGSVTITPNCDWVLSY